jgi:hypothetical protein
METLFVLLLYINGEIKEHMAFWEDPVTSEWVEMGMSGCLAMKRTLKRQGWHDTKGGRYACEKRVVETRINWEEKKVIAKIIQ